MENKKSFMWGFGVAIVGFALAWLLGLVNSGEQANKDKLAELHAGELKACWEQVEQTGGVCRIEYIKDRTDTIIGAKIIKEDN